MLRPHRSLWIGLNFTAAIAFNFKSIGLHALFLACSLHTSRASGYCSATKRQSVSAAASAALTRLGLRAASFAHCRVCLRTSTGRRQCSGGVWGAGAHAVQCRPNVAAGARSACADAHDHVTCACSTCSVCGKSMAILPKLTASRSVLQLQQRRFACFLFHFSIAAQLCSTSRPLAAHHLRFSLR